jgi:phosphohistidine phosphatase
MDLYLLRHGVAEERTEVKSDHDRSLTHDGKDKMHKICQGMKHLELEFDCILSSPFIRAKQTADIVAKDLGAGGGPELVRELVPGGDLGKVLHVLTEHFGRYKRVLVVGHEPDLSHLAGTLLTGNGAGFVRFKKGGLCKLKVDSFHQGHHAILEWSLTPTQLAKIR